MHLRLHPFGRFGRPMTASLDGRQLTAILSRRTRGNPRNDRAHIRARGEDEALAVANGTQHGLAEAVFTVDLARGARFAEQMQLGMAHVNGCERSGLPITSY